jgi:hypothetical protein
MSSPRDATARRLYKRLVVDREPEPDPSVPVVVSDDLVVWPDGRFIAALPAELVDDVESWPTNRSAPRDPADSHSRTR